MESGPAVVERRSSAWARRFAPPDVDDYESPRLVAWRRRTDGPFLALAIGSLPLLLLEVARDRLVHADRVALDVVNAVVLVAFAVDYVVELVLAGRRSHFLRREWASLLIVCAQAAALVPGLAGLGILRLHRAGRIWQLVALVIRMGAIGGAATRTGRHVLRRHAASYALGVAGFTWLSSAVAFTLAEDVGRTGRLQSFFDALWWSTTTITTVGYGDVFPVTAVGRVIGAFTMVVGISTFAVVTAKIAELLVRTRAEADAPDR